MTKCKFFWSKKLKRKTKNQSIRIQLYTIEQISSMQMNNNTATNAKKKNKQTNTIFTIFLIDNNEKL